MRLTCSTASAGFSLGIVSTSYEPTLRHDQRIHGQCCGHGQEKRPEGHTLGDRWLTRTTARLLGNLWADSPRLGAMPRNPGGAWVRVGGLRFSMHVVAIRFVFLHVLSSVLRSSLYMQSAGV